MHLHICTLAHSKESPAGAAVLALKDNQKTFHEEMLLLFEKELVASPHLFAKYEAPAEKNSGRIEKPTCWQTEYIRWFENIDEWYGLRSVIMVEAEVIHAMCKCESVKAPNGQSSAPAPVSERKGWSWKLVLHADVFAHLHTCILEREPRRGGRGRGMRRRTARRCAGWRSRLPCRGRGATSAGSGTRGCSRPCQGKRGSKC